MRLAARTPDALRSARIAARYQSHTMLLRGQFIDNLLLAGKYTPPIGDVVECGVWRGGVIRGLADVLGETRTYHLFDSFEGLPPAGELDGEAAIAWQTNVQSPTYYDNCSADESYARSLFEGSGFNYSINSGWFSDTLPAFNSANPIALLRLDGDWYDSTMTCLTNLFPKLAPGALVLIDDYHTWDGCARAVHDYLSQTKSTLRIRQSALGTCYLINNV
jgi:O-methyltransferase